MEDLILVLVFWFVGFYSLSKLVEYRARGAARFILKLSDSAAQQATEKED